MWNWLFHSRVGKMELVFLCLVFTLVADQEASAKETETIISAGNWVPVNSFDVGSGTYNR